MPYPEFQIASESDLPYLLSKTLELHQFETQHAHQHLSLSSHFESEIEHWLKSEFELENVILFLIQFNSKNIGYAHIKILSAPNNFTQDKLYGFIQAIWIDEAHRRHNVAKTTLSFIESIFKEQHLTYYELSYSASNSLAEKFWKAQGLEPISIQCRKRL